MSLTVESSPGRIAVAGPLTFATARHARSEGLAAIASAGTGELEVDCGAVTESDSAGLAVLLDWLGAARHRSLAVRFVKLPQRLIALAQISEIEGPLGVSTAA